MQNLCPDVVAASACHSGHLLRYYKRCLQLVAGSLLAASTFDSTAAKAWHALNLPSYSRKISARLVTRVFAVFATMAHSCPTQVECLELSAQSSYCAYVISCSCMDYSLANSLASDSLSWQLECQAGLVKTSYSRDGDHTMCTWHMPCTVLLWCPDVPVYIAVSLHLYTCTLKEACLMPHETRGNYWLQHSHLHCPFQSGWQS